MTTSSGTTDTAVGAEHLLPAELDRIHLWWRAANYLSAAEIYLLRNPLLREQLRPEHIKPRLLGHWGTTPGLNFIYAHLNRPIRERDLSMMYVIGPGHGGPGLFASAWLDGSYSDFYPDVPRNGEGAARLVKQFSFPGGMPSHVAAEVPGSIHEGGELGYSLAHAFGAALDNPGLIVTCIVGDGEAETGPLATSWHSNKFLNPATDGAVLPILHLNGYKIANPTVLARLPEPELLSLLHGYGYEPYIVEGDRPEPMHHLFAATLDRCLDEIAAIQRKARTEGAVQRPFWPMIVLRTPKGWTGPRVIDNQPVEGTWRSHQVPISDPRGNPEHLRALDEWLRSYDPGELFESDGAPIAAIREHSPPRTKRLSDNPHTLGGHLLRALRLPEQRSYGVEVAAAGVTRAEATRVLGGYLRDVVRQNRQNFRMFAPDENNSNRLNAVLDATSRTWVSEVWPGDDALAPDGRLMEVLSEHLCEGWLEGYLLTGRHGLFSCYEAFIHIVDSMVNQHAKWLKTSGRLTWRQPIASMNYLLTSHVWQQDHNGFSHQDPGFIDHVVNKTAEIARVYLPPDANTLLATTDHCLRSRNLINVIVAGKQPAPQYLSIDEAIVHCAGGIGIWDWASTDQEGDADVVMACAGDVPTQETLAAIDLLRPAFPDLRIRMVNVVDLLRLQDDRENAHGLQDSEFDSLFTVDKPVIFAYHGYPSLIHRLTYRRRNHEGFHVHGYREEGATTTPFDMCVLNKADRFHLAIDVIDRVAGIGPHAAYMREALQHKLIEHRNYVTSRGEDLPEVRGWTWSG